MYIKEACVEGIHQALLAAQKGADRIELCGDLSVGGVTPSLEIIKAVKEKIPIPIRVMIRPRGGDFVYTEDEFEMMKAQIKYCHEQQVDGVVFGILKKDNSLDLKRIEALVKIAVPMKVVLHKAIDETPDIIKALKALLAIDGITAILTSGGKPTAEEGKIVLKNMVAIAGKKLEILPAGSITDKNVGELHRAIGATSYHGKKIIGNLA